LLDEICEMDAALQVKLLRVLQSGEFTKVGGSEVERADVRYLCATNRDPWEEVRAGRLREDLYYRLHVVPCAMPPLRERNGDLVLLARYFLAIYAAEEGKSFTDFAPDAAAALQAHRWPGNIRELQNVLRNVVLFHDGALVTAPMLARLDPAPPRAANGVATRAAATAPRLAAEPGRPAAVRPLWQVEKEAIEEALAACGGNVPRAAALLEVNPSTLYRRKAEWDRERFASSA
jgi:two-component system, repressor protein LuxO